MSVHAYSLKFTQCIRYALEVVAHMRGTTSFFVVGLSHLSSKEGKEVMLIWDVDISRVMIHA